MRKITILSMITLDGVMQAPGGPGEDESDGFQYGGWVAPFVDETYDRIVQKELEPSDYLLGRKTFEIWAAYWPKHADMWPGINTGRKYVVSRTLRETDPLLTGWANSECLHDIDAIRKLKDSDGPPLQVWGSSILVQALLQHGLADEIRLKIHPVLLGKGKKLFNDAALPLAFTLTETMTTPKGVIIAVYRRAGEVRTGNMAE